MTSESNQVCRRRLIYSQVQSPVLLVTLYSCLGYVITSHRPYAELLPCPHLFQRIVLPVVSGYLGTLLCIALTVA